MCVLRRDADWTKKLVEVDTSLTKRIEVEGLLGQEFMSIFLEEDERSTNSSGSCYINELNYHISNISF